MKQLLLIGAALAVAALTGEAKATLITFDDVSVARGSYVRLSTYAGFTWNNLDVENHLDPRGYSNGIVSQSNAAFNRFGDVLTFSGSTPFTLNSAYFTAAFEDGTYIATGTGSQNYSLSFNAGYASPTKINFDWTGLTSVSIVRNDGAANGRQFVMDNLQVNEPLSGAVPEPATWALMLVGFGAIGLGMRRSKVTPRLA